MTHRHGGDVIASTHMHGLGGLGYLGSAIPSSGTNPAPPLFDDLNLPTDANKEYRFELVSRPSAGAFFMWGDSSFQLLGAPDGTYTITGYVYEDAVKLTPIETVTITVGAGAGIIDVPTLALTLTFPAPAVINSSTTASTAVDSSASPWVTNFGDTWNTLFPGVMNTYTNPVFTYHTSGTSGLVTATYDAGQAFTGDWTVTFNYVDVSGTAQEFIETNAVGGEAAKAVTGASNTTPIDLKIVGHGYATGDEILVAGVGGNTAANGRRLVTVLDVDNVSLLDLFGANIAGNGNYTSGGTASRWVWRSIAGAIVKATARYVRGRITTTGTMRVLDDGNVAVNVIARAESQSFTTVASGPTNVQLTGLYQAVKNVSVQPYGTTPMSAMIDSVCVNPNASGALQLQAYNPTPSGNSYCYMRFSAAARTIAAGDYLEYDVLIPANSITAASTGGIEIDFTTGSFRNFGVGDQNGLYSVAPNLTNYASGVWYSRKISLAAAVGLVATSWDLVLESEAVGFQVMLARNMRVTDGAGTTLLQLWSSGLPDVNQVAYFSQVTNAQMNLANSLNVWTFDLNAGTQAAVQCLMKFEGA